MIPQLEYLSVWTEIIISNKDRGSLMTLGQLTSKCLRAHGGPDAEISLLTGSPFPGNSGAPLKRLRSIFSKSSAIYLSPNSHSTKPTKSFELNLKHLNYQIHLLHSCHCLILKGIQFLKFRGWSIKGRLRAGPGTLYGPHQSRFPTTGVV